MQERGKQTFNEKAKIPEKEVKGLSKLFAPKGGDPYQGDAQDFNGDNVQKGNSTPKESD